ncbi:MAG: HAMP domain-containing histidine kinase [Nitrospirae bacterium]|nr:HAMP domain-containing histidine kinase [Nitrospirota bacterium]
MKISTRLFLYIFTLMLLLSAVLGYISVRDERYHLLSEVKSRAWMLSRTLSATFKFYHQEDPHFTVEELIRAIAPLDEKDVLVINVYDRDGNLVDFSRSNCTNIQCPHNSIDMEGLRHGGKERTFSIGKTEFISVVSPIKGVNGVLQGAVEVILSLGYINVGLSAVTRRFLLFTLVAASLLGAATYLISRWSISVPIRRLKEASEKLGEGDLGLRIEKSGVVELDELIDDFNRMAENLEQQYMKKEKVFREKLRLERGLRHSEKLVSIGQLTSGLAHEIGTPLNVISGRAEQLLAKLPEGHPDREGLKTIIRQADRISETMQHLLSFSRKAPVAFKSLDLKHVIDEAFSLCKLRRRKNDSGVDLVCDVSVEGFFGDEDGMRQMFVNLMLNSLHAMPDGGRIRISVSEETDNARRFVRICFEDDGPGIPPDLRARVFDPFFTTKDVGEGTGLGLFIVANIVQEHNGTIEIDDSCESGVRFIIRLPVERDSVAG